jgi:hypothetical protein
MNQTNKPKAKQKDTVPNPPAPKLRRQVVQAAEEVAQSIALTGAPPSPDHMAQLHGLGLLTEIMKLGADMVATRGASPASHSTNQPVDPRRQIDPRTRFKPR